MTSFYLKVLFAIFSYLYFFKIVPRDRTAHDQRRYRHADQPFPFPHGLTSILPHLLPYDPPNYINQGSLLHKSNSKPILQYRPLLCIHHCTIPRYRHSCIRLSVQHQATIVCLLYCHRTFLSLPLSSYHCQIFNITLPPKGNRDGRPAGPTPRHRRLPFSLGFLHSHHHPKKHIHPYIDIPSYT